MAITMVTNINTGEHNDTVGSLLFFKLVLISTHTLFRAGGMYCYNCCHEGVVDSKERQMKKTGTAREFLF